MAKKKTPEYSPADSGMIAQYIDSIKKDWGAEVAVGTEIKELDANRKSISTGSTKLDWALVKPLVEGTICEIHGPNKSGKAQPLDAKVLTPNGFTRMGDISIGDIVSTPNGGTAKVVGVYPQGVKEIYRVVTNDGSSAECCMEHLWLTRSFNERRRGDCGVVRSLEEIKNTLVHGGQKKANHSLPNTKSVEFSPVNLEIDPYVLGLLIGDGTLYKDGIRFSSQDEFILTTIAAIIGDVSIKKIPQSQCDYRLVTPRGKPNWLLSQLQQIDLAGKKSYDKFVPSQYLHGTPEQRVKLLRGLMDSDGFIGHKGTMEFSTTSEQLAKDVRWLVMSLGGKATINKRNGSYTKDGKTISTRDNFRVYLNTGSINPFKLPRKAEKFKARRATRFIIDVEYVGEKEAQCIMLDSDEHLYITDDFLVTHNTTMSLEIAANATLMGKPVFFFDLERKLVDAQIDMIPRLDRNLFVRIRPSTGEEAVERVLRCVSEVPGCVVIFDSLTQMLPEVEDAEDASKQTMGLVARLAAKMVRKILGPVEKNRCMVLFISHITTNMDAYDFTIKTKGGNAVPDISAQRIQLKVSESKSKMIKDDNGNPIGQNTICKIVKNNQGRAFREVIVPIIWGRGIDRSLDLFQIAVELSVFEQNGSWFEFAGERFHGSEKAMAGIKQDKEFRNKLIKEVQALL